MSEQEIETKYKDIVSKGDVISKKNRHNEGMNCDCDMDAPLSNYRDVEVEYDGKTYYFYHNTAIVVNLGRGKYRVDSGGWQTKSTKERINRCLPSGYKLVQKDFDWYVDTPKELVSFKRGMVIETE